MKKNIFRVLLIMIFVSIIRYKCMYIAIDFNNMPMLSIMSCANPLINMHSIMSHISVLAELFPDYCQPPLIYAITCDNHEAVRILLNNGANSNVYTTFSNKLALVYCLQTYNIMGRKNRFRIARLLLDYGAKYNNKNIDFLSAILVCGDQNDSEETKMCRYNLFIDWATSHAYKMNKNKNVYTYYAICGHSCKELLYLLKNYDINLDYKHNEDGITLLLRAIITQDYNIFELLIDYCVDANYIDMNSEKLKELIYKEVKLIDVREKMLKKIEKTLD